MKDKILFASFMFVFNATCYLQEQRDYNWQLGNKSDSQFSEGIQMNFASGELIIDTFYRAIGFVYFNASISDANGNLLLYSNGCQISDGNHLYITGTNHLNPGDSDLEWCEYGYPVPEGGLFLPFFNDSVILLLHQRVKVIGPPLQVINDTLFYTSLVKQDQKYILLDKTVPIVGDRLTEGNVEGIKASKPGAWWVIQGEKNSNRYFKILLDSARIDSIYIQSIGDTTLDGSAAGQAAFSPDGNLYARYAPRDKLFLFDFDRSSGMLSNYRKIHVSDSGNLGGIAFSPNGRFLYVSARLDLYQFDTWSVDVEASKIHIGHYDGYVDPFPTTFYHMQLGPDCRIYMNASNGGYSWHVIHEPDELGLNCKFEQHGIHFPAATSITMPNFPNYRLDVGEVCNPNLVDGFITINNSNNYFSIFPNPTDGQIWIRYKDEGKNFQTLYVEIRNMNGEIIFSKTSEYYEVIPVELSNTIPGVYIVMIKSEGKIFVSKLVKL